MKPATANSAFWRGFRDAAPFVLVVSPFALLFGVVATEAGLNLPEVMAFSIAVIAGAAQFTALAMMQDNAPTVIVLASALAVNMRMAMYSAALAPHIGHLPLWRRATAAYFLVDQAYALSAVEFERRPGMSPAEKAAYYAGTIAPVCPLWYVFTWVGAEIGAAVPPEFALDFAVPITFLALSIVAMRTFAHVVAATVSVIAALGLAWMPFNVGLILAALLAMAAGAEVERRRARA